MRKIISDLHPKIQKNLLDLLHERYLQKCHTIANLGAGTLLAFLGAVATFIIDRRYNLSLNLLNFILIGVCSIFTSFFFYYYITRKNR